VKASSAKAIFKALNQRRVRYLVAGGIAVNACGYLRFTKDVNFVIELTSANVIETFGALNKLGYHPNVAITAEQLANANNRQRWIEEKAMRVLQFWSDQHPETPVDLFIDVPFDFDAELSGATWKQLRDVGTIPVLALPTLVKLKRAANREQDRIDLENLRLLYPEQIEQ
jgi:hypothetical protein